MNDMQNENHMQNIGEHTSSPISNNVNNISEEVSNNIKENAKDAIVDKAKEKGTEKVAETALSSTGVGNVINIASKALQILKKQRDDMTKDTVFEDNSNAGVIGTLLIVVILFIVIISGFIFKISPSFIENGKLRSYSQAEDTYVVRGTQESNYSLDDLKEYQSDVPYTNILKDYIYGIDNQSGLRWAIKTAITDNCHTLIRDLKKKRSPYGLFNLGDRYDKDATLETFYANPFPYDCISPQNTIGNVLNGSYEPSFNDTNFAELMIILCQNPLWTVEDITYKEFNDFIIKDETKELYYEVSLNWFVYYYAIDRNGNEIGHNECYGESATQEDLDNAPDSINVDGLSFTKGKPYEHNKYYFADVTVKPMGLREMYMLADIAPEDKHNQFNLHTNYEMLDREENYMRIMARKDEDALLNISYTDNRESSKSYIYDALVDYYGKATGRSAWCYIADPYNLREFNLLNWTISDDDYAKILDIFKDLPIGSNSLNNIDEFLQYFYVHQQDIQARTGQTGLCCFSTYMMLAQYHNNIQFTSEQVDAMAKKYCSSNGYTQSQNIRADFNLNYNGQTAFNKKTINSYIDNGNPVVLWCGNGTTSDGAYHSTHFMLIVGYDDNSVKVVDPASSTPTVREESLSNIATWGDAKISLIN